MNIKIKKNVVNELKYTNGDVYKGETVDQIRHGKGIHQCSNGDVYDGNWSEDKRHGFGTMTFTSGMTYTGDWVEDKTCGYGKCTYANGDVYEGEWKNDHRWGWGKHEWRSTTGDTYEGEWFDDIPEGDDSWYCDKCESKKPHKNTTVHELFKDEIEKGAYPLVLNYTGRA